MVEVIAEITNTHQGKPEIALQLAESAVQAGGWFGKISDLLYSSQILVAKIRLYPNHNYGGLMKNLSGLMSSYHYLSLRRTLQGELITTTKITLILF